MNRKKKINETLKKRLKKKQEKAERREQRKLEREEKGPVAFEDLIRYVDVDGNLTAEKPGAAGFFIFQPEPDHSY